MKSRITLKPQVALTSEVDRSLQKQWPVIGSMTPKNLSTVTQLMASQW
jgi:hypothetical protein